MRVHVVHGILDPVGTSGLLKLVPYLQAAGFDVRVPDYGLITACETRIVNPIIVRSLRPYIEAGDIYIGHSNGCAIGYDLLHMGTVHTPEGAPFAGMILINAALRRDILLPGTTWADVYFNHGDDATVAAVLAERLGLVDSVWGEMGHAGYLAPSDGPPDPLITNIDCGQPSLVLPTVSGHGDIFSAGKVEHWAPFIVGRLQQRLLS